MHEFLEDEPPPAHREVTLSTPLIVLLFLVLAVVCGVFFGLGYRAHTSRQAPAAAQTDAANPASHATFSGFKPPAGSAATPSPARKPADAPTQAPVVRAPEPTVPAAASPVSVKPPIANVTLPAPVSTGTFVVQLAAISPAHADDAEMLVSSLRAKGYAVAAHKEADSLLHVQVGPFATKHDAEGMRERLKADGYNNAFVK